MSGDQAAYDRVVAAILPRLVER